MSAVKKYGKLNEERKSENEHKIINNKEEDDETYLDDSSLENREDEEEKSGMNENYRDQCTGVSLCCEIGHVKNDSKLNEERKSAYADKIQNNKEEDDKKNFEQKDTYLKNSENVEKKLGVIENCSNQCIDHPLSNQSSHEKSAIEKESKFDKHMESQNERTEQHCTDDVSKNMLEIMESVNGNRDNKNFETNFTKHLAEDQQEMSRKFSGKCVDLLLIGKTGNGKSALGNAILRREIFKSSGGTMSVTFEVNYDFGEFEGCYLKVVDVPGVGETRLDKENSIKYVMIALDYAIKINSEGYHAFLLVIKYGQRFTIEESEAIMFLKKIFGEDFINKFCIIVMTRGDDFVREMKKKKLTLPAWCDQQDETFKALLKECNHRIIVFDNITECEKKQKKQVAELLQMVDNLASAGKRYTNEHFEAAKNARDKIMSEAREPMIRDETMRETSLIIDRLNKILKSEDLVKTLVELEELSNRAKVLHKSLKKLDKGTGALHEFVRTIKITREQINNEKTNVIKKERENERNKKLYAEKERNHKLEKKKLQEEADKKIKEKQEALEKANKENEEKRKTIENELKIQEKEKKKKEEEIETIRKQNEEKEKQYKIKIEKLNEEVEKKIKEEQEALEKANKENEENRKKIEIELKIQEEEKKKREEEIEKISKQNEEKERQYEDKIQQCKDECERLKEEKEFREKANKDNEDKRKKVEDELRQQQEEKKQKEEEIENIRKEKEEKERQYKIEIQNFQEEAARKLKVQEALEIANKENEERKKKLLEEFKQQQEEKENQLKLHMQELKAEAENKKKEVADAFEKERKENDAKTKKLEDELKKTREQQRQKEEDIEKIKLSNEQAKNEHEKQMQKLKDDIERKMKENQENWEKKEAELKCEQHKLDDRERERVESDMEKLVNDYKNAKLLSDETFLDKITNFLKTIGKGFNYLYELFLKHDKQI